MLQKVSVALQKVEFYKIYKIFDFWRLSAGAMFSRFWQLPFVTSQTTWRGWHWREQVLSTIFELFLSQNWRKYCMIFVNKYLENVMSSLWGKILRISCALQVSSARSENARTESSATTAAVFALNSNWEKHLNCLLLLQINQLAEWSCFRDTGSQIKPVTVDTQKTLSHVKD